MYCLGIIEPVIPDYNKRLILLSVIQLSGGHCIIHFFRFNMFKSESRKIVSRTSKETFNSNKLACFVVKYIFCVFKRLGAKEGSRREITIAKQTPRWNPRRS